MDEVRKKSLSEVLPKKGLDLAGQKSNPTRRQKIDLGDEPLSSESTTKRGATKKYYETTRVKTPRLSFFVWFCIALILIVGGYFLSTVFASVTVKITPRHLTSNVAGTYTASRAPAEGIEFSVIKLEETATKSVPASGQSKVETKAVGTVVITNNFSTASQKLVAGTRLETKNGLIFKLDNTVTVPGQTKKGTTVTPGAILAKVTASEAGEDYNVGQASLKIVGFKGTPRYDKFTVQTRTNLEGGKQGVISVVKPEDRAKALAGLEAELKDKVAKKARLQIPKDFIIWNDGVITSLTDEIKNDSASSSNVILSAKVTMIAILFNVKNVSEYFAEKELKDESVTGIRIFNIESLKFTLKDKDKFDFEKTDKINFTLDGEANLVWPVDSASLKSKLLNTSIKEKDKVFASFPSVYRAEAVVRPPWVLSFPNNQDKINIKLIIE